MAILKAIGNTGKSKSSLRNVINYVGKKAEVTQGILCSNEYEKIYEQFNQTKDFYGKNEGRQYKHYVISFDDKDNITKDQALKISKDFIENNLKGYEGFIAIHDDKNLHSHIVINSVSLETGKKYNESSKDYARIKDNLHNYLEQNYNLKKVEKKEKNIASYDKNKYKVIENDITKNKKSDIVNLAKNYNNCLKDSLSKEDFIKKMKVKGYEVKWSDKKNHVTFEADKNILTGKKNKFRLENLRKTFNNEIFSKEKALEKFSQNRKGLINDFAKRKALNTKLKSELREIQLFKGKVEKQKVKMHEIKKQLVLKKEEKAKPIEKIKQRVRTRGFGR